MEEQKGWDFFPLLMLIFIAGIFAFLLFLSSIAQPKCQDKVCPAGMHPIFFKETGCTCLNKRIK